MAGCSRNMGGRGFWLGLGISGMRERLAVALTLGFGSMSITWAQSYPARPVTMVVPFAAGGPADTVGRILTQRLSEVLGQQVVVENVGGAGGMTGSDRVAKAAPDG